MSEQREFIEIDDPTDERLAIFGLNERGLSNRPQRRADSGEGWFVAEGDLVVERALAVGCVPVVALVDALRPPDVARVLAEQVTVYAAGESVRARATKLGVPNRIIAVFERPPRPTVDALAATSRRLILVEAVDNPVNIGSIVRNAAGLGWDGLIIDTTSADPLARRSLRVSMGHALGFPHARTNDVSATITSLVGAGYIVAGLTPAADAVDLADWTANQADGRTRVATDRLVLCVGAERSGLSDAALAAASVRLRIPMTAGIDSLNVAAATAIACWALCP